MTVTLDLPGGHLAGSWDTRTRGAHAVLHGNLHGHPLAVRLPAP
jgi:hypothetical protein